VKHALLLAWRHFRHYRGRSALLVLSIVLVFLLPVTLALWVDEQSRALAARADATPLVVGARGSRFDLALAALYFRGHASATLSMAEVETIVDGGLADPVPLRLGHSARPGSPGGRSGTRVPIVGTTHDYYGFRGLSFAQGGAPAFLGEAVVGARAARELGLATGDTLLSDQGSLHDLAEASPVRLRVVGVLAESGTPDDGVVLCDIKTAWILDGIGHGHAAAEEEPAENVLRASEGAITLGPATYEYTEIDEENRASFHFHGDAEALPVEAILCLPRDRKSATLSEARYRVASEAQCLVPSEVVGELLGLVFRLKRLFDANVLLVSLAMAFLFALVFLLSLRLRAAELETLRRIGFARATIARLVACEWLLILVCGALLVLAGSALLRALLAQLGPRLLTGGGLA
jgi:putative ABC transport system permease protein